MNQRHALVIGGSLGGLFAANLLRSIGWEVTVFERTQGDLGGRGAGLGTRAELFDVMRRIGSPFDASIGAEVHSRIALSRNGDTLCEVPIRAVTTAWDRMYAALRSALPPQCHRSGMLLERFEQDDRKIAAIFAEGSRVEGDLLIGADGIYSTVRRQVMPELKPRYAGYVSWRGVGKEGSAKVPFHPMVFRHMTFCFPEGELALSAPMPGPDGAAQQPLRCYFNWFRPVEYGAALRQMCTDASGQCHGDSIPPPLIRTDLIDALKAQARVLLAPQIAALIAQAERPVLQPIFDLESPRIVFGRAVLLGDAAFVARPHVGTGVTKAALDAQCLADALLSAGNDMEAALLQYDGARRQFGTWLVSRGRYLGGYLEAQSKPHDQRCEAGLVRHPETFMREFGGAGVIEGALNDAWTS
jgi:2-polyprenyl-6-methoxyphenol hydroxylase-like FAD-dependent oxidoreductase